MAREGRGLKGTRPSCVVHRGPVKFDVRPIPQTVGPMIVAPLQHTSAEGALRDLARPGEEVVTSPDAVIPAVLLGFPRLGIVWRRTDPFIRVLRDSNVPVLVLGDERWTATGVGISDEQRGTLERLVSRRSSRTVWSDRLFADLERVAGAALPVAFTALARRPLEYPRLYTTVSEIADPLGLSRGALNQAFQRTAVPSPGGYLRWMRLFSAAHLLAESDLTTARAAHRLGFQSSGTLCRAVKRFAGVSTEDLRGRHARDRLMGHFVSGWLRPEQRRAWDDLGDIFVAAA